MTMFPERLNWGGKIHPEWSHRTESWETEFICLFPDGKDNVNSVSCTCHHTLPTLMDVDFLSPCLPHLDRRGLPVTMPSPLGWIWTSCHHAFPTWIDVDFLSPRLPHSDERGLPVTMSSPLRWTWTSCHHTFPTWMDVDFLSPRPPYSDGCGLPVTMPFPLGWTCASCSPAAPTLRDRGFPPFSSFCQVFCYGDKKLTDVLTLLETQRIRCEWRCYTWV